MCENPITFTIGSQGAPQVGAYDREQADDAQHEADDGRDDGVGIEAPSGRAASDDRSARAAPLHPEPH